MKRIKNIPKAFIGFLVASACIWVFINLTKEYLVKMSYPISFEGLSQDKILKDNTENTVDILVRGSGFKLITSTFSRKKLLFSLQNLKHKNKDRYYITTKNKFSTLENQLRSGIKLVQIFNDTIFLRVDVLQSKKVPLVGDLDITYAVGYGGVSVPKIVPDSVVISGSKSIINNISKLELESKVFKNVSANISEKLNIVVPNKDVKISAADAMLNLEVDKFTEGELKIPVEVIHFSKGKVLTIFPKQVSVFFKVGLKNYSKITPKSFEVICDYREVTENKIDFLIPKLKTAPGFVSSVRIVPEKIDFLIQK